MTQRVWVALDIDHGSGDRTGMEAIQHALDVLLDGYTLETMGDGPTSLGYYDVTLAGIGDTRAELAESIRRRRAQRRAIQDAGRWPR